MSAPTLTVVVPVHNEVEWIEETLQRLRAAIEQSPWRGTPIVVVDDGSTDGTPRVLAGLAAPLGLDVVTQDNAGRLEARAVGLSRRTAELALLVDARVHLGNAALAHVAAEMDKDPSAVIWNGDVTVATQGNPYAGFWSALTMIGWHRWYGDRSRASYGLEDFDRYPKGTGLFLAPRLWLIAASTSSDSLYDQARFRSDDTALIRHLAGLARIHLSSGFSCTYHGRDALVPFARHAYFRGTTFIDSYLGQAGVVGSALNVALPLLPVAVWWSVRRPRAAASAVGVAALAGAATARGCGATPRDASSLALLSPVFGLSFGAGLGRGLVLALRAASARRTES